MHSYWPEEAIRTGLVQPGVPLHGDGPGGWPELPHGVDGRVVYALASTVPADEVLAVADLVLRAAHAFGADPHGWSVDLLQTTDPARPWVVTDMALAEHSWHWPGCARAGAGARAA